MPHLVATLIYLSQIYSYYMRGDRSPLKHNVLRVSFLASQKICHNLCDAKKLTRLVKKKEIKDFHQRKVFKNEEFAFLKH